MDSFGFSPPGTIMLAAAASGVMYLVFYTLSFYKMDRNKIKMNDSFVLIVV